MKRDEHLLWDVSALRSFVISGRNYETLEFIISSLTAFGHSSDARLCVFVSTQPYTLTFAIKC